MQEKEKLVDPFASFSNRVSSIYSDTPYGHRVSSIIDKVYRTLTRLLRNKELKSLSSR
jgi:hypothetical protein